MNVPDDVPGFDELSVSDRVDLVCDAFEKAWLGGEQPRIEDFLLAKFSAEERLRLVRELLIAELELRRKTDKVLPSCDDYRKRFPDAASIVDEVFRAVAKPEAEPAELFAATMLTGPGSADTGRHSKVGDYELLHEIARGGMGVVYKARHTKLGRLAAVKLIRSGDLAGEEEVRRFYAEAEAASQLDHPGIVPLFEAGQENGQHYLAMAFVDGPSLWQKVKEQPLESRKAARVMQQVAEAVQHAHERGIIHRDLKPQNILMTSTGQPRVTDFGLAKQMATDSSLTATGQVMGTPSYMPPEQASGSAKELDQRADVYSLGATLYCLLTGRPPFQAATLPETLRQVCEAEPVALRIVNPSIPLDLETICLKALRKERNERYDTAQEFADDLGRFLADESILARPAGQSERFARWCKRNRTVALLSAAVAILFALIAEPRIVQATSVAFDFVGNSLRHLIGMRRPPIVTFAILAFGFGMVLPAVIVRLEVASLRASDERYRLAYHVVSRLIGGFGVLLMNSVAVSIFKAVFAGFGTTLLTPTAAMFDVGDWMTNHNIACVRTLIWAIVLDGVIAATLNHNERWTTWWRRWTVTVTWALVVTFWMVFILILLPMIKLLNDLA